MQYIENITVPGNIIKGVLISFISFFTHFQKVIVIYNMESTGMYKLFIRWHQKEILFPYI